MEKQYKVTYFRNGHKYSTIISAKSMVDVVTFADIICDIPMGNIVEIKEV